LNSNKFHFKETSKKAIAYTDEFKAFNRENPRVMGLFLKLAEQLKNIGETASEGDMSVELIDLRGFLKIHGRLFPYYKVKVGTQSFFIKTCPAVREFRDTLKARDKLQKMPNVEVIEIQFAYNYKSNGYLVVNWLDLPTIEDYLKGEVSEPKRTDLISRLSLTKEILGPGYWDNNERNAFYDENRDKIILFDLNESQQILQIRSEAEDNVKQTLDQ